MTDDRVLLEVQMRDDFGCVDCGVTTTGVHHIVPRSACGKNARDLYWRAENMIVLCGRCHNDAHNPEARARHLRWLVEMYGYTYEDQWLAGLQ